MNDFDCFLWLFAACFAEVCFIVRKLNSAAEDLILFKCVVVTVLYVDVGQSFPGFSCHSTD